MERYSIATVEFSNLRTTDATCTILNRISLNADYINVVHCDMRAAAARRMRACDVSLQRSYIYMYTRSAVGLADMSHGGV